MRENKDLIWLIIAVLVLIGILPTLMWRLGGEYMSGMTGMMGYGWGFMSLLPVAFFVLIALGAYYLITESTRTNRSVPNCGGRALEILKERYAKGEITREQFLKMKAEVES